MLIHFWRNGFNNQCVSPGLPRGQTQKIIFAQYKKNGKYYQKLTINGGGFQKNSFSCGEIMLNETPRDVRDVLVRVEMKI